MAHFGGVITTRTRPWVHASFQGEQENIYPLLPLHQIFIPTADTQWRSGELMFQRKTNAGRAGPTPSADIEAAVQDERNQPKRSRFKIATFCNVCNANIHHWREDLFLCLFWLTAVNDPLFILLFYYEDTVCVGMVKWASICYIVTRSLFDIFYLRGIYEVHKEHRKVHSDDGLQPVQRVQLWKSIWRMWRSIWINIEIFKHTTQSYGLVTGLVLFPAPQIMIILWLLRVGLEAADIFYILSVAQLLWRTFRFIVYTVQVAVKMQFHWSRMLYAIIFLALFIQVAQVIGPWIYFAAFMKVHNCLKEECLSRALWEPDCDYLLYCSIRATPTWAWGIVSNSTAFSNCFDPNNMDNRGLLQRIIPLTSAHVKDRYIQTFSWGLTRLISLMSKDDISTSSWEAMLQILLIFVAAFITTVLIWPSFVNMLQRRQKRNQEALTETWDYHDLAKSIGLPHDLKEELLRVLVVNKKQTDTLNEDKLIEAIPEIGIKRRINEYRYRNFSKISLFKVLSARVVSDIKDKLKLQYYMNGENIQTEGSLVTEIVFLVEGKVNPTPDQFEACFFGEEWLLWYLGNSRRVKNAEFVKHANMISTRTISCSTLVRSFILKIDDFEEIINKFRNHLWIARKKVAHSIRSESLHGRFLAAIFIQRMWRRRSKKMLGPREVLQPEEVLDAGALFERVRMQRLEYERSIQHHAGDSS